MRSSAAVRVRVASTLVALLHGGSDIGNVLIDIMLMDTQGLNCSGDALEVGRSGQVIVFGGHVVDCQDSLERRGNR